MSHSEQLIKRPRLPGFISHIVLLWRLRMSMSNNTATSGSRFGKWISTLIVFLPTMTLGGFAFWFMSHPSVAQEQAVTQFYLNLLCFVTAMLWILWPVLSAGVEDGSERDRYHQFPISEFRLLSAAIISGVLKPVGLFMFSPLIGATLGTMQGQSLQAFAWSFALLLAFIAMCATWSQAGVYWLRDILRSKSNGQALTLTLLVFILLGMLMPQVDISWLYKQGGGLGVDSSEELERFANIANAFSKVPPGYLGEGLLALKEARFDNMLLELFGLCALAFLGLLQAKYRLQGSNYKSASTKAIQENRGLLFTSKGSADRALLKRELFELWRNPRFRLLAVVPFFLIVVLHLVSANQLIFHFFGDLSRLWLLAGVGFYAAVLILLTFTHNTFAYDGRGLLNLINAPITPKQILSAKARIHRGVSLLLGCLASLFYGQYVLDGVALDWLLIAFLGVAMIVPVVTTIGLWVSVYYPVKFDASLNRKERQPLLVSLAGFAGCVIGALPFILLNMSVLKQGQFQTAILILSSCGLVAWVAHVLMLRVISNAYDRRQSIILSAITRV